MRWEQDLTGDIRFHNGMDDRDCLDYSELRPVTEKLKSEGIAGDFTPINKNGLRHMIQKMSPKVILEIGVEQNPENETTTSVFLDTKAKECKYFGVDLKDKSFLQNKEEEIYTIQTNSSNYAVVIDYLRECGANEIDFLFIDGWHSINQVLTEWEYTSILSEGGIVGFHDINYHPGPKRFFAALDETKWEKMSDTSGMGVGYVGKKT